MKEYPPYKIFISFFWVLLVLFLFQLIVGKRSDRSGKQIIRLPVLMQYDTTATLRNSQPGNNGSNIAEHPGIPDNNTYTNRQGAGSGSSELDIPELIEEGHLEFPGRDNTVLDDFFRSLLDTKERAVKTRILYYGDSQIEGHRIVNYLRTSFQTEFGGSGSGINTLYEPLYSSLIYNRKNSRNWKKFSIMDKLNSSGSDKYGIGLSYCSFSGKEAGCSFTLKDKSNKLQLIQSGLLFIESHGGESRIVIASNDIKYNLLALAIPGIQPIPFNLGYPVNQVDISISSDTKPVFYGISFESDQGVIIDHFPLRGSAGLEFSLLDPEFFRIQCDLLNPQLVILQFGINVVPAKRSDFDYYRQLLIREIRALKSMCNNIPVLVIGVSDMAKVSNRQIIPFASVSKVSQAMRAAASQTGSAFFDLLQFMGGPGACILWEGTEPPLMRKDFTHFTVSGGEIVADGLYSALIKEYNDFLKRSKDGE